MHKEDPDPANRPPTPDFVKEEGEKRKKEEAPVHLDELVDPDKLDERFREERRRE